MNRFANLLWLWTLIIIPIALFFPLLLLPFKCMIKPMLGSVILAMGLTLSINDFKEVLRRPFLSIVGVISQYSIMPIAGFFVGLIFFKLLKTLPSEYIAGQILTGSCPTGVVSNVYNFLAQANVALSICLSAINTFIAPFLTPFITKLLAGRFIHVDVIKLFMDMIQVTLLPVLIGLVINTYFPEKTKKIEPFLPVYSTITVVIIIGYVVAAGRLKILHLGIIQVLLLILGSAFHLITGYVSGFGMAKLFRLSNVNSVTISIETAMQNSGLATVLALSQWGPISAIPAIIYSVIQNIIGPFVCSFFNIKIIRK